MSHLHEICIYIYELFIAFVFLLFVHYCNLMVCVVYWVGKWRSRGSTGIFGNLMAIYHIMLQFIQNHYKSTFSYILNGFSCLMCLFKSIFYEEYDWSNHSMIKGKFKKVNNWTTTTYAHGCFWLHNQWGNNACSLLQTPADKDQLIWVNSWHSKTLSNMSQNSSI